MMEGAPPDFFRLITLFFLLLCSMFFSSGETAFVSCNVLRIKYLAKKIKRAQYVLEIIKEKNKFLITTLIGNSIVNILTGILITSITLKYATSSRVAHWISASLSTILLLLFGEIVPKSVALSFPEGLALKYSPLTRYLIRLFLPLSTLLLQLTSLLLRMFGIKVDVNATLISEDDLKIFFEHSHLQGELTKCEKDMMMRILSYDERRAKDVMVRRAKIMSVNIHSSIDEALYLSKQTSCSRFPVFKEDIDDIQGILYIQDILFSKEAQKYLQKDTKDEIESFSIRQFLREPIFIFANTHLWQIRKTLKDAAEKMAIVVDEYGGTLGLVTIEDLNEQIFGEIVDEYDKITSSAIFYKRVKEGILLKGDAPLSKINDEFGLSLSSKNALSIAGWMLEELQEMPNDAERVIERVVEYDDMIFEVHRMSENRIVDVLMKEKK